MSALGPAQCWCGKLFVNSHELVQHWKRMLEKIGNVLNHTKEGRRRK